VRYIEAAGTAIVRFGNGDESISFLGCRRRTGENGLNASGINPVISLELLH
jgi:hypothetical protein